MASVFSKEIAKNLRIFKDELAHFHSLNMTSDQNLLAVNFC